MKMTESYDLWIDFNDLGRDGHGFALLRHARSGSRIVAKMIWAKPIIVGDEEGNRAQAIVTSVWRGKVGVLVDLSTLIPGPEPE